MLPSFKALIFDLDGTLVDSSEVVRRVMESWCLEKGIPLQAVLEVCHGGRTEDTVAWVAPHLDAIAEATCIEQLEHRSLEGLKPIPGADSFLASLGSQTWAVVTSSSNQTAKPKLLACNMPCPRVLITAESVVRGKPDPEPFLTAAGKLGVEPEQCLVFEDADNGVNSALAAGFRVILIGIQVTFSTQELSRASPLLQISPSRQKGL